MTTPAAANLYLAQHLLDCEGKGYAVFNPLNKPAEELPVIYGFNNGGAQDFLTGQLVSEDGYGMGSHLCSDEAYMPADLGILEGTRSDRHEGFQEKYPEGYRMEFVPSESKKEHEGFQAAITAARALAKAAKK